MIFRQFLEIIDTCGGSSKQIC